MLKPSKFGKLGFSKVKKILRVRRECVSAIVATGRVSITFPQKKPNPIAEINDTDLIRQAHKSNAF